MKRQSRNGFLLRRAFLAVAACYSGSGIALPDAPSVAAGQASFSIQGNTLSVTSSPGAIINWAKFSIGADEVTRFLQQSASSSVLNRVIGQDPSAILGQLQSNGRVFLINPNGIVFGAGARIDVGGLVASTLNLSDADFIAGRMQFRGGGAEGALVNRGEIRTPLGGQVALIAPRVDNHGLITTPGGDILLAAGKTVEIADLASPGLRVLIAAPENEALNVGTLIAQGGRIGMYGGIVRNSGRISADAAVVENGRVFLRSSLAPAAPEERAGSIRLQASYDLELEAGSRLSADGPLAGSIELVAGTDLLLKADTRVTAVGITGGSVKLTGERIGLLPGSSIDVSGEQGGGTVLVGGDYQGRNPEVRNAQSTYVGPDAEIRADALQEGDGGKVIVWADDTTQYYGAISARGGASSGNGGLVETSGKLDLRMLGSVDASAPNGAAGNWLLDPANVTIQNAASANGSFDGGSPNIFTTGANNAVADVNAIQAALNGGTSVTVLTTPSGTQAGNITVNAAIGKTAGGDAALTLSAANNIVFNAGADVTASAGALDLVLNAPGAITTLRNVSLNGGTLTLNATGNVTQSGTIQGATAVVKNGAGIFTASGANTYTGATTINAGTLTATNAAALGTTAGGTTVASGATLNINNVALGAEAVTLEGTGVGAAGALQGTGAGASLAGAVTLGAATSIGGAGTLALTGGIGGTGSLTKVGAGTLNLGTTASTYDGATTVSAGTLRLTNADVIPDASALTVAAGATFNLNNFAETVGSLAGAGNVVLGTGTLTAGGDGSSTTYGGVMSGAGGLAKAGGGTLTLSGANTYTGATAIGAGTLTLGAANRIANTSAVTVAAGAAFDLNNFAETVGSIAGAGNITLGSATLTSGGDNTSTVFSGVASGTGGLAKAGTGTLTLSGANTYTGATAVNAGSLLLGAAERIADASAVSVAAGATLDLSNFSETVGSLAGAGSVALGAGTLTAGGDDSSTTYSGVMSGTGGLNKAGTGTMTLSGANTYTGATAVDAGTLRLGAANRIADASALTVAAGATFNLNNFAETVGSIAGAGNITLGTATLTSGGDNSSTTFSGTAIGTGGLAKAGTGTLTFSGANTYTGATTVSAGTLALSGGAAIADTSAVNLSVAGASLALNADETIGSLAGVAGTTVALAANALTAGGNNTTTSYTGVIDGTGGLTKLGTGTMTLSGANTYTGATAINAGTLALGAANRIADASSVVVNGGTFAIAGFGETVAGVQLVSGSITGTGGTLTSTSAYDLQSGTVSAILGGGVGLNKSTAGTVTLSGANSYTGATAIDAGTLRLGAANRIADTSAVTVAAGATFNLNNFAETVGSIAGAGDIALGSATLTSGGDGGSTSFSGAASGTGGLAKAGTGTLTLSGANTYTGTTTVSAGTLALSGGAAIADTSAVNLSVAGANLTLNASETVGSLAGVAGTTVTLGANTLTAGGNNTTTTYTGVIGGTGGLAKAGTGTMTLSGANTYTGATAIDAGTLRLGAANRIADTSAVTVAAGAAFNLNNFAETVGSIAGAGDIALGSATLTSGGDDSSTSFSGVVSGTGGLAKAGTGTLTLGGANTYSGATAVNAGVLSLQSSTATGTAAGGVTVAAGAALELQGGITVGAEALTLNGTGVGGTGALRNASGDNTWGGTVTLATNAAIQSDSGTLTLSAANAVTGANRTLTFDGAGSGIISGTITTGTGTLTKNGAGTLTLSGANTYSGTTAINAGTLVAAGAGALGSTAAGTTVANGATLNIDNVAIGAETVTLNGTGVAGAGALTGSGNATLGGQVTLASDGRIGVSGGNSLVLNGAVQGAGALDIAGGGSLTLAATVGGVTALASLTSDATTALAVNGGLVRTTGSQSYGGATTFGAATTLRTTGGGNLSAAGAVTATAGTLTLDTGAGNATFNNAANNFGTVAVTSGSAVSLVDANALTVAAASLGSLVARTLSGDLTLGGNVTASGAGDSIVLASAANFLNPGASSLAPGAGRWLIYSTNPASDTRGGLVYGFKQYNAAYGVTPVAGAGNGFLYSVAPVIAPGLAGSAAKVYDGSAGASTAGLSVGATGAIDGDTVALSAASALYDTKNVGTGKTVSASISLAGAANGGKPVYGYQLGATSAAATVGTITQASLTVTADDATRKANESNPPFSATYAGLVGGESAAALSGALLLATPTNLSSAQGSYTITPSGLTSSNYAISFVPGTLRVAGVASFGFDPLAGTQAMLLSPAEGLAQFSASAAALARADGEASDFLNSLPPSAAGNGEPAPALERCGQQAPFVLLRCGRP